MGVFRIDTDICFIVKDLESAEAWYRQKFDCKTRPWSDKEEGDWDDVVAGTVCLFGWDRGNGTITLVKLAEGSPIVDNNSAVPFIYCKKAENAQEFFSSRGLPCSPIQQDRDGSRFFEIQDLDGNKLQILEG
jgi:hypothetical protein